MNHLLKTPLKAFVLIITGLSLFCACTGKINEGLIFVCSPDNDLYRAVAGSNERFQRYASAEEALEAAQPHSGLLVLADGYLEKKTPLPAGFYKKANAKNLRLYVEYPSRLPGGETGKVMETKWERGVITSEAFGNSLKKMRIVMIHDCRYVEAEADQPDMVIARVAGFDYAVYGLDQTEAHPLLFNLPSSDALIATTKLSHFITGRYAPKDAWQPVWNYIFKFLRPGESPPALKWEASVRPAWPKDKQLSQADRLRAARKGVEWYYKSNLLATIDEVNKGVKIKITPDGTYGKEGIRECFLSKIRYDGSQPVSETRRADCTSESAMAIALRGMIDDNERDKTTAANMQDYIYVNSLMRQGPRNDPESPEFGFIDWFERKNDNEGVYYADDNARVVMGTIATSIALKTGKWDEMVMANILAHYRATSPVTGFKPRRLDASPESGNTLAKGWRPYHEAKNYYHFAPHYQAWIMAMYLWLYDKTKYEPLLDVAKTGIEHMMNAYPDEWHWTNGMQQERARMILPLAWLLRIEDTPQHRAWLDRMVDDLLAFQDACGAIREDLGSAGHGQYAPPESNAAYGTSEAPLIQENGDPVADMLYTSNFAFLSLTEAAAVTGDEKIKKAVDKLADFMVKIQVRSETHPELDGAWYRAFEYRRWEYWASNADLGWGVWSTETGWTQGWINAMLMLRELNTNYWDFTSKSAIANTFEKYKKLMLEDIENK